MRRGWPTTPQPILDLDSRYVETSGGLFARWPDRSGMGHHATPISVAPTVESNVFGSLPGVRFIDANLNALFIPSSLVEGNGSRHVFVVYRPESVSSQGGCPIWMGGDSGPGARYFTIVSRPDDDPRIQVGGFDGEKGFTGFGFGARTPGALLADAYHHGTDNGIGKNGGEHLTAESILVTTSDGTVIGNRRGGGANMMFVGHIGRIRVYPRKLSAAERAHVCASLMATYGVTP